jgi:Fanconi anemia group M protein
MNNVVIFVDNRELRSNVVRELKTFDALVRSIQLKVGDYICSDRVIVERKTSSDFLSSIFNQRLFKQLESLVESCSRPVLIIEGNPEDLFLERNVNPNAIRGVLASIAVDYNVPMIWTMNSAETAAQVYRMAWREQIKEKREIQIRAKERPKSLAHQQEFLVSGLPGVSTVMARRLLKKFKSPEKLFRAKRERLMKVEKIGEEKAKKIKNILEEEYKNGED